MTLVDLYDVYQGVSTTVPVMPFGVVNSTSDCQVHRPATSIGSEPAVPDRQLSKSIDDLRAYYNVGISKHLPAHHDHLPWAGFGLKQPHWLILNARFH